MPTEYEEEEIYAHCMDCGMELDEDNAWYSERDSEYRCLRHHEIHESEYDEDEDDNDGLIHSYSYKPSPNFLEDDGTASFYTPSNGHSKNLYMGFELETELTRPTVVRGNSLLPGAEHILNTINNGNFSPFLFSRIYPDIHKTWCFNIIINWFYFKISSTPPFYFTRHNLFNFTKFI